MIYKKSYQILITEGKDVKRTSFVLKPYNILGNCTITHQLVAEHKLDERQFYNVMM